MSEHHHSPRIVACSGCGKDRWCGYGPCACGAFTECDPYRADQIGEQP